MTCLAMFLSGVGMLILTAATTSAITVVVAMTSTTTAARWIVGTTVVLTGITTTLVSVLFVPLLSNKRAFTMLYQWNEAVSRVEKAQHCECEYRFLYI